MTDGKVVCVIDDDEGARNSLVFLLEADGFVAEPYESADTFMGAWIDAKAGCIVTDVRMPGIDGIALLRELRQRGDNRPVIVVSGHADIPLAIEAIRSGAFDFIEKPFEAEVLLGLVRAALDPQIGNSIIELAKKDVEDRIATLNDRERQVFERLCSRSFEWLHCERHGHHREKHRDASRQRYDQNGCVQSVALGAHGAQLEMSRRALRPSVPAVQARIFCPGAGPSL